MYCQVCGIEYDFEKEMFFERDHKYEVLRAWVEDFTIYPKIGLISSMKGGGHYGDK